MTDHGDGSPFATVNSRSGDEFSNRAAPILEGIRREECSAVEEMYGLLAQGVRWYLTHHLGPEEAEEKVLDVLLVVLRAIRYGSLREPERLLGFVATVARRTAAAKPERRALVDRHSITVMKQLLSELSERDRDILTRFYLRNQTEQQICEELNVAETHFRLLKSRAKARFDELRQKKHL
jgi:RNA polymerase sigma-70 factor (ECF subfamily)